MLEPIQAKINLLQRHAGVSRRQGQSEPLLRRAVPDDRHRHAHRQRVQHQPRSHSSPIRSAQRTRFRSLEVDCAGDRKATWSARGSNGMNPSEISPLALYTRIFGPEFRDPNAANFVPDPDVMVRHSVLSGVTEQRQQSDAPRSRAPTGRGSMSTSPRCATWSRSSPSSWRSRRRCRPAPCRSSAARERRTAVPLVEQSRCANRQFAQLLAHALACGQTQVFNVTLSQLVLAAAQGR